MRGVVVNSSPIIALCSIGKLGLLKDLYGIIMIPQAVFSEVCTKSDSVAKNDLEMSLDWINVVPIKSEMTKAFYKSQLHDGEVEVMILGKEMNAGLIIIDDKNAKKHAKYLGFNVAGTLGVLVAAKKAGLIPLVKPLIDKMVKEKIYLSDRVIELCLKQVGE